MLEVQLRWKLSTSKLPASPGKARIIEGVDKVYHKKLEGGIRHNTWICILPRSKKCPPLVIFSKWIYTRSISGLPYPHIPQVDISDMKSDNHKFHHLSWGRKFFAFKERRGGGWLSTVHFMTPCYKSSLHTFPWRPGPYSLFLRKLSTPLNNQSN